MKYLKKLNFKNSAIILLLVILGVCFYAYNSTSNDQKNSSAEPPRSIKNSVQLIVQTDLDKEKPAANDSEKIAQPSALLDDIPNPSVKIKQFNPEKYGIQKEDLKKIDPTFLPMLGKSGKEIDLYKNITPVSIGKHKEIIVSALIRTTNQEELKSAKDIEIGSVHGDILTARFPLVDLPVITSMKSTVYIEASRILYPMLDVSVPATNADKVRALGNPEFPFKGKNVLIGIIDTGIDWRHGDFIDNNGNTRILGIWDQELAPSTSPIIYYDQTEINSAIQQNGPGLPSADTLGHGTHVAGIAAGDGSSTGAYAGMAPESKLLICKQYGNSLSSYGADASGILDGITWMLDQADIKAMPLVVNLSSGNYLGPHDGSTLLEQAIDTDVDNKGLIIVISAGNSRALKKHAKATVDGGGVHEFIIDFTGENSIEIKSRKIQFWYSQNDTFSIRIKPDVDSIGWSQPILSNTSTTQEIFFGADAYLTISNGHPAYSSNGDNSLDIDVLGVGSQEIYPRYRLEFKDEDDQPNGPINGYIIDSEKLNAVFATDIIEDGTIAMPGSCQSAITVASYNTTKLSWPSIDGYMHNYIDPGDPWEIAKDSAKGPLRNENSASKPDIAAPGKGIVSSLSSFASTIKAEDIIYEGEGIRRHMIAEGTSMAAPHVTGAIALLLENFPQLTCDQVKKILKDSAAAAHLGDTIADWGAGKLNILEAYRSMVGFVYPDEIPQFAYQGKFTNIYNYHLNELHNLDGLPVKEVKFNWEGNSNAYVQEMTNGAIIYIDPNTEAFWLGEGIWNKWYELGNLSSQLGMPISTETPDPINNNYPTVTFQHGSIYWDGSVAVTVIEKIQADFSADPASGYSPLGVQFSDLSTFENTTITSWEWDFNNDGIIDSTDRNPSYSYSAPGNYAVSLTISNGSLTNSRTKYNLISVTQEPVASDTDIVQIEYFFDADPGMGNGESIPISPGNIVTVQANISLAGLTPGLHRLYVRAKDEFDKWGIVQMKPVLVQETNTVLPNANLTEVEYFFDTDPNFGNGAKLSFVPEKEVQISGNINLAGLNTGLHRLYVRAKDTRNKWGIVQSKPILVQKTAADAPLPNIVKVEYFIDNEPGFGSGIPVGLIPGSTVTIDANLLLNSLPLGDHRLYVRAQDDAGTWGIIQRHDFSVVIPPDTDNDGLPDYLENRGCTNPNDADTDDDGIPDGVEDQNHNVIQDAGETDPCYLDTDHDGIQDGTEKGYTLAGIGIGTDTGIFQPDLDPSTTTSAVLADSDGDGFNDGMEDANHNGRMDQGEFDPNDANSAPLYEVSWSSAAQNADESAGSLTISAVLGQACPLDVLVPYTVSGTATASGVDHDLADGSITIPAGRLSGAKNFQVVDDHVVEDDETVIVTMGSPNHAKPGSVLVHTVTISDNEKFSLYIQSDTIDGSTTFTDSSGSGHEVNRYGDTKHAVFGNNTAIRHDGAGDYLKIPAGTDWNFGTGDFTIDLWVYFTSPPDNFDGIFSTYKQSGVSGGYLLQIINSTIQWYAPGTTGWMDTGMVPVAGEWVHLAAVRSGSVLTIYVNGVDRVHQTCTGKSFNSSGDGLVLGKLYTLTNGFYFSGYMDEIRVTKGHALWTGDFTPPNTPDAMDTDSDRISDDQETGTYLTNPTDADSDDDGIEDGNELSYWGASWNTDYDGDEAVCPNNLLDPDSDNDGLNDGSELNTYFTDPSHADTDSDGIDDSLEVNTYGTDPVVADTDGDGMDDGDEATYWSAHPTAAWDSDSDSDGVVNLLDPDSDNDGFTDGKEIVATTDPADSASFPLVPAGNALYLKSATTPDSIVFTDESGVGHVITRFGDTKHATFGTDTAIQFDGNGDYLKTPASSDWNFGTGDFTIDLWVNFTSTPDNFDGIFSTYKKSGTSGGYLMQVAGGTIQWYTPGVWWLNTGVTPVVGQWYHLAAVRSGNVLTIYVNGVDRVHHDCTGLSFNSASDGLVLGKLYTLTTGCYFGGYMDEVRVTKGYGLWAGDFIPPNRPN